MGMEVEHVRLFAVFLAAGLVEMNSESLHFSNASSIEKQIQLYPQAVSRLGQHLLRANSKVENFGLFALYSSFFLFLSAYLVALWPNFGCYLANSLSPPMLLTAIGLSDFGPELDWEGLGLYTWLSVQWALIAML